MSTPVTSALEAENLRFGYRGTPAVCDVTLTLREGQFLGLAGPNGAGKTTLLNLLTGYLHPASGSVRMGGRDLARLRRREIAAGIAVVPQRTEFVYSYGVLEMVLMGRQPYLGLAALDTPEDIALAEAALDHVGASHLRDKAFDELSGGEQQLVLIARALAQEAPVVVLDEPATFLDLRHQYEIMELLAGLARGGRAVLATFQDLNLPARWCTHLAIMRCGTLASQGTPAGVLDQALLREVYGIPLVVEAGEQGIPRVEFPR